MAKAQSMPDSIVQQSVADTLLLPADSLTASAHADSTNVAEPVAADTATSQIDDLSQITDSIFADTDALQFADFQQDSVSSDSIDNDAGAINSPVFSKGEDSTVFVLDGGNRVLLYGNGNVQYQNMELTADFIDFNMDTKVAYARATWDSAGNAKGRPIFKQGSETFTMDSMYFNFETNKAKIYTIITQQQDGYLHGKSIKRMPDNVIYVEDGKYTTCDAEHPHYYLAMTMAKVIPDENVITGPSYFVLADVPIYFAGIPFGFFPASSSRASGIIVPSYGEETSRGFYFRDGGYYLAISEYFDIALTGSFYTLGSKEFGARSTYTKRYRFNGYLNTRYAINKLGEEGTPTFSENRAFSLQWTHSQDPKFSPNKTFSASVNYANSSYKRSNETTLNDALTNTTQSSISYSQKFENIPVSMSIAATHSSNSRDSIVNLGFPTMSINVQRITPFKRKERVGAMKWYENIGLPLSISLDNKVTAKEREFGDMDKIIKKMRNGLRYNTSLSVPFNVLKFINLTPSVSYNGRMYLSHIEKRWVDTSATEQYPRGGYIKIDTITPWDNGLAKSFKHDYDFSTSVSASTRIYGMVQFIDRIPIQAIRHVISPSVGFSWRPDFSENIPFTNTGWGMYTAIDSVADKDGKPIMYSYNEGGIYGTAGRGKSASMSFSLGNTLEMKVRSKSDTTGTGSKKIKLLEALNFSSSWNFLADSMKLAPISFSARTTLFEKFGLNFTGTLNPYAINEKGNVYDKWQWYDKGPLLRLTAVSTSFSYSFNRTEEFKHAEQYAAIQALDPQGRYDGLRFAYVDFSLPWNFSFSYSFSYQKPGHVATISQTLNFSGDVSLTKNWKIGFQSGWDFKTGSVTSSSFNLHRDLHCWEMRFSWIPIGSYQSWNFGINVKSAMLKDLKYDKQQSRFDQIADF
ncbi:hypothetical protein FACS189452_07720 [Bacteroidia bacterium]|nr:hypothetical protein FACS189452_07720 [Bacteroidia bacterium]